MQLTPKERAVLVGVYRDREQLRALDGKGEGLPRAQLGTLRMRINYARAGLVPMDLAGWIGHAPTPSEHVMYHRVYGRLETAGLVERHRCPGRSRTTHLSLTPAGEALARELAGAPDIDSRLSAAPGSVLDASEAP